MRCDNCHEREAVVHLTQITGEQSVQLHLCEKCAAEKGIEPATALVKSPLGGILAQLQLPGAGESGTEVRCPRCGAGLSDLREAGRLGCAECWEVFAAPLADLVRRLHGATRHAGERYAPPGSAPPPTPSPAVEALREQLRQAVAAEEFERAARLRDELRSHG